MEIIKNKTAEFTLTIDEPIEIEKFYSMLGLDSVDFPDRYDVGFNVLVQKRNHKNKRVNKKWLKKYGYKMIKKKAKGWKMNVDTNGNIEFVK